MTGKAGVNQCWGFQHVPIERTEALMSPSSLLEFSVILLGTVVETKRPSERGPLVPLMPFTLVSPFMIFAKG